MNQPPATTSLAEFRLDYLYSQLGMHEGDTLGREAVKFIYRMLHDELAPQGKSARGPAIEMTYEALSLRNAMYHGYHEDFFEAIGQKSETDAMYLASLCGGWTPKLNERELTADEGMRPLYPLAIDDRDTQIAHAFWSEAEELLRAPIRDANDDYYAESLFVAHVEACDTLNTALTNFENHDRTEHISFNREHIPLFQGFILPHTHIGQCANRMIERFRTRMDREFGAKIIPLFGQPE